MEKQIKDHLLKYNLDVRKSRNARFMDQKVTPDILSFIADCIINLAVDDKGKKFTAKDIWNSQYFLSNIKAFYNKPDVTEEEVKHEYDKLIQQPLKTLSYAKILNCEKRGITNHFQIKNYEILEHVSFKDKNAFRFLYIYLIKVLKDSNELKYFEEFKNKNQKGKITNQDYARLKERFQKFLWGNTNISSGKKFEPNRIFPKILNVYAVRNQIRGSSKGFLSKDVALFGDLTYNRVNFRDLRKSKSISRQEASKLDESQIEQMKILSARHNYLIKRAMDNIRKIQKESEVKDDLARGPAVEVHHIFPKHEFPEIAHYVENLIKLTPSQHSKAHSNRSPKVINKDYQLLCLLSKADIIDKSIKSGKFFYSKESFIFIVSVGLSEKLDFSLSLANTKKRLIEIYNEE